MKPSISDHLPGASHGWRTETLDYALQVRGDHPGREAAVTFDVTPDRRGDVHWYAFDASEAPPGVLASGVNVVRSAAIPGPVRFRGMPNRRFWDLEDARYDLATVTVDRRGLAAMILLDFMLVHGNDWYIVPVEVPAGTLSTSRVSVVDVFGETHDVPRASAGSDEDGRFAMYSLAGEETAAAPAFILPVSAGPSVLESAPLEEVRFLRDDVANLAWGVEHIVEDALGRGERTGDRPPAPPAAAATSEVAGALRYRIQSAVPPGWIPFQPVRLPGTDAEIALERAQLLSFTDNARVLPVPRGKVLSLSDAEAQYHIREEQIPREGTRVTRLVRRARGADGTTHVWIARTRGVGTGESSSGLVFDQALPVDNTHVDGASQR